MIIKKEEIVKIGSLEKLKYQKNQPKVKDKPNTIKSKIKKMNNIKKSIQTMKYKNKREKEVETIL